MAVPLASLEDFEAEMARLAAAKAELESKEDAAQSRRFFFFSPLLQMINLQKYFDGFTIRIFFKQLLQIRIWRFWNYSITNNKKIIV